jgi:hypothetical protein
MNKEDTDINEENVSKQPESAEVDPNALGVNDLNLMVNILDAVAPRGGIRANEMEVVGNLYTRLMNFLVSSGVRQGPENEMTKSPAETSTDEGSTNEGSTND